MKRSCIQNSSLFLCALQNSAYQQLKLGASGLFSANPLRIFSLIGEVEAGIDACSTNLTCTWKQKIMHSVWSVSGIRHYGGIQQPSFSQDASKVWRYLQYLENFLENHHNCSPICSCAAVLADISAWQAHRARICLHVSQRTRVCLCTVMITWFLNSSIFTPIQLCWLHWSCSQRKQMIKAVSVPHW